MSGKFEDAKVSESEALSIIEKKEAEACVDMDEEFFNQKKIDFAFYAIKKAMNKNPNLPGIDSYFYSYAIHKSVAKNKSWYSVLGIRDHCAGVDTIKKYCFWLAKNFKQDQHSPSSVAVTSAKKLIIEAYLVLSDASRREAYDLLMGFDNHVNPRKTTAPPAPSSSSSSSSNHKKRKLLEDN